MPQSLSELKDYMRSNEIKFVDFRFTDSLGRWHHITRHADSVNSELFNQGMSFDGSSIPGWKAIEKSDMLIVPDLSTAFSDPFTAQNTLVVICDVIDTESGQPYSKDPRATAKKAMKRVKETGIADRAYFGLEIEFFIFESVRFAVNERGAFFELDSHEGSYNSDKKYEYGNHGHRPGNKGGYSPAQPVDSLHDIRSEILDTLSSVGLKPVLHHHEVAPSQCEVGFKHNTLLYSADDVQKCKYVVWNVAASYGKTATFIPKPIFNDNGNGMHCHQSLWKEDKNLFASSSGEDVSQLCKYYIGGIIKHGKALNAFTNPTTNSYKRLVSGFEAPTKLAYSSYNRSASIRIPFSQSGDAGAATRIEVRFPDPSANPYYCISAQLMAGLDGIKNKTDPGKQVYSNLYETSNADIQSVASSLREALDHLDKNREFLKEGGVFTDEQIDAYIKLKREEDVFVNSSPHPAEFVKYYSV